MTAPPIQRFLSEVNPEGDPFDLLGLEPERCTDEAVRESLRLRLDRIAAHPLGRGPEADEVRLALHVAAALLLDPRVRAEIALDRRVRKGRRGGAADGHAAHGSFEQSALWAIAASGGWNDAAKRRLASLAHAHQVDFFRLRDAVIAIGRRAAAERAAAPITIRRTLPADAGRALDDRAARSRAREARLRRVRRWASLAALIVLSVSTLLAARSLAMIHARLSRTVHPPAAPAPPTARATRAETPHHPPTREPRASAPAVSAGPAATAPPAPSLAAGPRVEPARTPETIRRWSEAAHRLLASPLRPDADARLARAVSLARMNRAAAALWSSAPAEEALRAAAETVAVPSSAHTSLAPWEDPAAFTSPGAASDGALALELLAARRQPGQILPAWQNRRFVDARLGPADCDAVASAALFGSPQELRLIARRIVADQADNPAMIHALLESLPRAVRHSATASLIAEVVDRPLPSSDDPAWPARARAALVERLAELLGPRLEPAADPLASELAEACRGAAGPVSDPARGPASPAGESRDAVAAAEALRRRWLEEAAPYRAVRAFAEQLTTLDRRAAARRELARGPVQAFVAEQSSILDLMAFTIARERPSEEAEVALLIADASAGRASARHVFEQIEINESAAVRLWMIRLGAERPGRAATVREREPPFAPDGAPSPRGGTGRSTTDGRRVADLPVPELATRLAALTPRDPLAYFLLAEEAAYEARTPDHLAFARTLLVLAHEIDRGSRHPLGLARSACLALAPIARSDDESRWLRALADISDADGPSARVPAEDLHAIAPAALALAEAIGCMRASDSRAARDLLAQAGVAELRDRLGPALGAAGDLLAGSDQDASCPGCRNRRVVRTGTGEDAWSLCPTCRGNPGPRLSADTFASTLAVEASLLHARHDLWSAQVWLDRGAPQHDPDPRELASLFGVDGEAVIWRPRPGGQGPLDGEWVRSPANTGR